MECVILAGGLGTRMRPATHSIPKAMIPVAGRPFVDLQLEWLGGQGVTRVVLCIGHGGSMLRQYVDDGRRSGLAIDFVDEGSDLRGTGGALRLAFDLGVLPERFMVLYGDSYLPILLTPVWTHFCNGGFAALMTVLRNEGRWGVSNARYEEGRVVLYDKSGAAGSMSYIDYGLSVLARSIVADQIPPDEVVDLADVFHQLSVDNRLGGYEVEQRFFEIGSPAGLAELEAHLNNSERTRA